MLRPCRQCAAGGVAIVGVGVGIGVAGGSHGGAGAFALMLPAGVAGVTTEEGEVHGGIILSLKRFLKPLGVRRGQGTQLRIAEANGYGHPPFFSPGKTWVTSIRRKSS